MYCRKLLDLIQYMYILYEYVLGVLCMHSTSILMKIEILSEY